MQRALIESNPCATIDRLPEPQRDRYISDAEYAAIYAGAEHKSVAGPKRLRILMELCYRTGQRIDDVLHVQDRDIDEEGVYVQQGKTGSKVLILWTPELHAAVERAAARRAQRRQHDRRAVSHRRAVGRPLSGL